MLIVFYFLFWVYVPITCQAKTPTIKESVNLAFVSLVHMQFIFLDIISILYIYLIVSRRRVIYIVIRKFKQ